MYKHIPSLQNNLFGIVIAILCLSAIPLQSHAANKVRHKAVQQEEKNRIVLMPMRVPEEDKNLTGAMETALVEGLQQKYVVFSGEQVSQKAHEIFMKESRNTVHNECDETKCMQNIAIAFQAELLATANVTKQDGIYYLALSIQNIFDNKVVYSKSLTCENCNGAKVIEKLKELSGTVTPVASASVAEAPQANANLSEQSNGQDSFKDSFFSAHWKSNIARRRREAVVDKDHSMDVGQKIVEVKDHTMIRIPGKKYEMGKYNVSQAEWRAVMGTNPSDNKNCDDCPVEHVSWEDAQEFIQKLNAKTGGAYRLPTEREWTYACMGGESSSYTCSPAKKYDEVNHYSTHKVGQQKANGYGLYDMNGNVRQWMEDFCTSHADGQRVLSGTAWDDNPNASRNCDIPSNGFRNGFRLARTVAAVEAAKESAQEEISKDMIRIPGKNYEMGKYDVTQAEWRDIMGTNPSNFTSCGENCPVEQVSWNDIQEFLQKLNAKTGRQYRLPNEKEWEYACYGGSQTEYCGGNDPDSVAWYDENSNRTTHPVGQKQPNGYGLYDMSGNVWQWMQNKYGSGRALRGGSWYVSSVYLRAADRNDFAPTFLDLSSGFRLARTLP